MIDRDHPTLIRLPRQLRGERVVLRPLAPGDGIALFAAVDASRDHLRAWLPWVDAHKTVDDSEHYCRQSAARWLLRDELSFGLFTPAGSLVGGVGLVRFDLEVGAFEVGYWLRTDAQRAGRVREAVALVTSLAFEMLDAARVAIHCDRENERSAAVPRALGFVHEATLRRDRLDHLGRHADTLVFAMTLADYERCTFRESASAVVAIASDDGC